MHEPFRPHRSIARMFQRKGWHPCPGNVLDPRPGLRKFERWHKRPQRAWRLYWVIRPSLYEAMRSSA